MYVLQKALECYKIVTVDLSDQSARIALPLRNSAVGFVSPGYKGAQSPQFNFGGFFCARLAWQLQMVGRAGASSDAPVPLSRSYNPVRSATSFVSEVAGNKYDEGVQPC